VVLPELYVHTHMYTKTLWQDQCPVSLQDSEPKRNLEEAEPGVRAVRGNNGKEEPNSAGK
jgi:hypothetical protein